MPNSRKLIVKFDKALAGDVAGTNPPLNVLADVNALRTPSVATAWAWTCINNDFPQYGSTKTNDGSTTTNAYFTGVPIDIYYRLSKQCLPKKLRIYSGSSYQPANVTVKGYFDGSGGGVWETIGSGTCVAVSNWDEIVLTAEHLYTHICVTFTSMRSSRLYVYEVQVIADVYEGNERAFTVTQSTPQHINGNNQDLVALITAARLWDGRQNTWLRADRKDTWKNTTLNKVEVVGSELRPTKKYETLTTDQKSKPVTCSNQYSTSYAASYAFDGSTSYLWRFDIAAPQWVRLDYGVERYINRVRIYIGNISYAPKGWTLYGSNDGTSFTAITSGSCTNGATGWQQWDFENHGLGTFRYYKFEVTSKWSTTRCYVYEVELSGLMYEPLATLTDYVVDLDFLKDVVNSLISATGTISENAWMQYHTKLNSDAYAPHTLGTTIAGVSGDMSDTLVYVKVEFISIRDRSYAGLSILTVDVYEDISRENFLELMLKPITRLKNPNSVRVVYNPAQGTLQGVDQAVGVIDLVVSDFNNLIKVPNPCDVLEVGGTPSITIPITAVMIKPGYAAESAQGTPTVTIGYYLVGTEPI